MFLGHRFYRTNYKTSIIFPHGNFLGARLGHNPSYVWRSIHTSQVLVKFGARWKIGDGTSINVWQDPWVKGAPNSLISSPVVAGAETMTVSDLFDSSSGRWNTQLLQQTFAPQDQNRILSMTLHCRDQNDSLIWNPSLDGLFLVKSAYYTVKNELIDLRVSGDWCSIWKLKIPSKVILHLWRIARGVLPCHYNLQRRHVQCLKECPLCESTVESEWHLFFEFP